MFETWGTIQAGRKKRRINKLNKQQIKKKGVTVKTAHGKAISAISQQEKGAWKLTFLGSGSAFCIDNFQSNMLLEAPSGKCLLIDCGTDCRRSLAAAGKSAQDIDAVFVSHPHSDHVGGLGMASRSTSRA